MKAFRGVLAAGVAGSLFCLALTAAPQQAFAQPAASVLKTWVENPWTDTNGGKLQPDQAAFNKPWEMVALRNDTEQVMIGLLNSGKTPMTLKVALESDLPQGQGTAELLVVGGILARLPPHPDLVDEELERDTERYDVKGRPLMNLFTPAQLRSFEGKFPETFTNTQVIRDFPTLQLSPGESVRLWVRVRTFEVPAPSEPRPYSFTPAGTYSLRFKAEGNGVALNRELKLKVIDAMLPAKPTIDVFPYGGLEEQDDKLHHTTVRVGHKRWTFANLLASTGPFNARNKQLTALAETDPEQFQKEIEKLVDLFLAKMQSEGWTEDQIYVEVYDEPQDENAHHWVAYAKAVRKYRPDLKIIANPGAHWSKRFRTIEKTFKPLAPYVDLWTPHITHYDNPEVVEFLKSTGKPLGYYYNCAIQAGRREPGIVEPFRRMGWTAIKHDLKYMAFWSASRYQGDPWNDFDRRPGPEAPPWPDAAVVFPSSAGPITTRNWEAWRECVEDVEIYRMVRRAYESGVLPPKTQQAAKTWLAEAPDKILDGKLTAEEIEQMRLQGVQLLEGRR